MSTAKQQKSNVTKKQVFEVNSGCYYYETEVPGIGKSTNLHFHYEFGEVLSRRERKECLSKIGSGSNEENAAIMMLRNDRSPEYLQALLSCLPRNTSSVPIVLMDFENDAKVLPALIEAYKLAPLEELGNLPYAISLFAKGKAGEILLLRFQELIDDPEVFLDDEFYNFKAADLSFLTVEILLRLPTNQDALNIFIKLLNHPCKSNRNNLISTFVGRAIAFAGSSILPIIYQIIIEQNGKFPAELNDYVPAEQIFVALLNKSISKTVGCLKEILYRDDENWWAHQCLGRLPEAYQPMARKVLLEYLLAGKTSLWQTQDCCSQLGDLVPEGFLAKSLAKEKNKIKDLMDSESPSERFSGIQLLDHLDPKLACKLASYALQDEPDPALQNKSRKYLGTKG